MVISSFASYSSKLLFYMLYSFSIFVAGYIFVSIVYGVSSSSFILCANVLCREFTLSGWLQSSSPINVIICDELRCFWNGENIIPLFSYFNPFSPNSGCTSHLTSFRTARILPLFSLPSFYAMSLFIDLFGNTGKSLQRFRSFSVRVLDFMMCPGLPLLII